MKRKSTIFKELITKIKTKGLMVVTRIIVTPALMVIKVIMEAQIILTFPIIYSRQTFRQFK